MRLTMLALFLLVVLGGSAYAIRPVGIACLGDSNTAAGWPDADTKRWCEYADYVCPIVHLNGGTRRAAAWYDFGIGGAVVVDPYIGYELDEADKVGADAVILAFGTNDAGFQTPDEYAQNVLRACQRARRPCWVMTMPPHPGFTSPDENDYNAAVARVIPASKLIDRTTDMTFLEDGTHLDDASQHLLAARAAAALGCE